MLTKDIPFACGFAARNATAFVIHLIRAVVLSVILIYLSPLLTIFVLVISAVVITYLSISYEAVIDSNLAGQNNNSNYRREVGELVEILTARSIAEPDFCHRINSFFATGYAGKQLNARLSERQERQTGSLVMEYIYPIAIIAISLMYTYVGEHAPDITHVALYFLLIRQVVMSFNAIGKSFMSLSKHHRSLLYFMDFMSADDLLIQKIPEDDGDYDSE